VCSSDLYNQSGLLAKALAKHMKWEYCEEAIARIRETETQTHLNAQQRRENVAGAFAAAPAQVEGRCVIVVDDVLTTGATLGACAAALRAAGAQAVYGVALASAVFADAGMGVFGTPGLP
jgi:predicted amidophosphoribosyltransferase